MIPKEFKEIMPASQHSTLMEWWGSLGPKLQNELILFYEEGDAVAGAVRNINKELDFRERIEIQADELRDLSAYEFPNQDYYENLIGNEIYLDLRGPIFHICKAHKKLRSYLLLGFLPKKFSCFIKNSHCEMAKNLNTDLYGFWKLTFGSRIELKQTAASF